MSESDQEISVSSEGLVLKGEVVSDIRPAIRRISGTADSVLRLIDNVVRLPADYISNNLERFRCKYAERFEEIPVDRRCEPSMRIGCSVLKEVAYSAEEPDIQDLFANLLASASDTEKLDLVHPGFATVISEMLPFEAKLLASVANQPRQFSLAFVRAVNPDRIAADRAISNLIRLGLLDWSEKVYSKSDLQRFIGRQFYSAIDSNSLERTILPLVNDVQKLKNELVQQLGRQHIRQDLEITAYGRNFIEAVISNNSKPPENED